MNKKKSDNFTAVILAAGKGTRMGLEMPKVLVPLKGKPLLFHVIENLDKAGCNRFIIIVGYKKELIQSQIEKVYEKTLYKKCEFIFQEEQLGTGHAVLCAEERLKPVSIVKTKVSEHFVVVAGDMPMLRAQTFKKLLKYHLLNKNTITVLTAYVENPTGYGRIVKNDEGAIYKIVEERDASLDEKALKEINTGTYVFHNQRAFPLLKQIGAENMQGEYYLPDMIAIALKYNYKVSSFALKDNLEARGVNTPLELSEIEALFSRSNVSLKKQKIGSMK